MLRSIRPTGPEGLRLRSITGRWAAGAAEERARAVSGGGATYRPCVSAPKGLAASTRRGAEDDGR